MVGLPEIATPEDLDLYKAGDPTAILRQATTAVRNYCEWHIAPVVTETMKLDGNGGKDLYLPTQQIVQLISVTNAGVPVDLDDIDDSEAGYLTLVTGCWSTRPGKSVVQLQHGFETAPDDVVAVILAIAARAVDSPAGRTREHGGLVDIGFGLTGAGVSGGLALLEHEKTLLDRFRVDGK